MISKPDGSRPDSREIEKRSSIHDPSKLEIGGPRTDLGQSRGNPRASALADLYRHAAALADAGDIAGARTLREAIGRLLGDERAIRADVIDLNEKRRPCPREPRLMAAHPRVELWVRSGCVTGNDARFDARIREVATSAGGAHPRDPPTRHQRHFLVSSKAEGAGAIRPGLLFSAAS